jgi:hypothetical protein
MRGKHYTSSDLFQGEKHKEQNISRRDREVRVDEDFTRICLVLTVPVSVQGFIIGLCMTLMPPVAGIPTLPKKFELSLSKT